MIATSALAAAVAAGCGQTQPTRDRAPRATAAHTASGSKTSTPVPTSPTLRVTASRTLPAPVQLPALTARTDGTVLALGGLSSADASTTTVIRVAPGRPRALAGLPTALHDAGGASLGTRSFVLGGGTATGSLDAITPVGGGTAGGRLVSPASDLEAVALGGAIYAVGGYDGSAPLRTVTRWRPGRRARVVAVLPHALRYAAVATIGTRILVAGGTDGVDSQTAIYSVDVARHTVETIGQLPVPISHTAGAALNGRFYLIGGRTRGDETSPRRQILAIDPASGRVRRAGVLPRALGDVGAAVSDRHIVVVGGRDATGAATDEVWTLTPA